VTVPSSHFRTGPAGSGPDPTPHRTRDLRRELKSTRGAGRVSAWAIVAATTLILAAMSLTTPAEVRADQTWSFTIQIGLGTLSKTQSPSVTVRSDGSFEFPLSEPPLLNVCNAGFTLNFSGTMTGTAVKINTVSGSGCDGPLTPLSLGAQVATLTPLAFPNARSFQGPSVPVSVTRTSLTFSGTCGNCPVDRTVNSGAQLAAALGSVALTTTGVQTNNVGLRLNSLRGGATGMTMSGLSFDFGGQSVPLAAVASLVSSLGGTGGASADRSSMLSRLGIFANGQGSFGNQSATSREPGFDFHTAGLTVGADYRVTDQLILGLAVGYLRTKMGLEFSAGDSRVDGYSVTAYGNYFILPKLYLDGIATFGWNNYDIERTDVNATAKADTDGTQFAFSMGTGYNFNAGPFTFGPTARVNYTRVHIDGYRERGADPLNVTIARQTIESVTSDVGGQASYAISLNWGVLTPLVRFDWEHEYKNNSRVVTSALVADPTFGGSARTNNPDRDYFNLGAGLSATMKAGVSAFLYFEETRGRAHFTNHSFSGGVRVEF